MVEGEIVTIKIKKYDWFLPSFIVILYALLQASFFISMMNRNSFGLERKAFLVGVNNNS